MSRRPLTPQECANLAGIAANRVREAIWRGQLKATVHQTQGKSIRLLIERADAERFAARIDQRRQRQGTAA